jgi:hypothetical protein
VFHWNYNLEELSRFAARGAFDFNDSISGVDLKFVPRFGVGRDSDAKDHILAIRTLRATIFSTSLGVLSGACIRIHGTGTFLPE